MRNIDPYTIEMAYAVVQARKDKPGSYPNSYASKLLEEGTATIAQKLGEQALETVIAAMRTDANRSVRLAEESADLLYHLLVLWADADLMPQDVYNLLASRMEQRQNVAHSRGVMEGWKTGKLDDWGFFSFPVFQSASLPLVT